MADTHLLVRAILLATAFVVGAKIISASLRKRLGPLPPGPKGLPLLGNIMDLPPKGTREWEHWLKHRGAYGPISSITILGKTIVVLHSAELALELFEKRSLTYSARPEFVYGALAGWANVMSVLPNNKLFRHERKLAHTVIGTRMNAAPSIPLQDMESHRFLFRVLQEPELFVDHIRTQAGTIILKIVYGYTVDPHKPDPLVQLIGEAMERFAVSVVAGSWFVDIIPALRHFPKWMPGTGWKEEARASRVIAREVSQKPMRFARQRVINGSETKSLVTDVYKERGSICLRRTRQLSHGLLGPCMPVDQIPQSRLYRCSS